METPLQAWIYIVKNKNGRKFSYWIFHLRRKINIDSAVNNWVFYDCTEECWCCLDTSKGLEKYCQNRVDYENLARIWQDKLLITSPPFSLLDIRPRQLKVWTFYPPINEGKKFKETIKPKSLDQSSWWINNPNEDQLNCIKESLQWIFHLKKIIKFGNSLSDWLCYNCDPNLETQWISWDINKQSISDQVASPVNYENLLREWPMINRSITSDRKAPRFSINDIVERYD